VPVPQAEQETAPVVDEKEPAAQLKHDVLPATGAY